METKDAKKLCIDRPIIVEGRYDKIKLSSILDADIITTEGFGIFRAKEKTALIRRLADEHGVIIFTDSDGGGRVIRNYFNSILDPAKLIHLYIPQIEGKEKRKKQPSAEGFLGVEGIDADIIREIFAPYSVGAAPREKGEPITKGDMYADGLSGGNGSSARRAELARRLGFPADMSANAMLSALNMLYTRSEYKIIIKDLFE